jgi:3-methyladenine DNA glycosylase AlkD
MPKTTKVRSNDGKVSKATGASRTGGDTPDVKMAVDWLKSQGSKAGRDGMARYAIPSDRAFGVAMRDIQALAKRLGRNHELAAQLWATGWYEARLLACYVDEPVCVTSRQMDEWCQDFDNWAICDTVCFALFDRTPHAWSKVEKWSRSEEEFIKRAAFALLWGLTAHDDDAKDEQFVKALQLVERAAADDRNFVKKSVNMALRAIGKSNRPLNIAATKVAERLAASSDAAARWVGKDALRELASPAVAKRIAQKERKAK